MKNEEQFKLIIERLHLLNTRSTYDSHRGKEVQLELDKIRQSYRPGFHRKLKEIGICAATILPELGHQRSLIHIICNKVQERLNAGDKQTAQELILLMEQFLFKLSISEDSFLIQEFVTIGCAGIIVENEIIRQFLQKNTLLQKTYSRLLTLSQLRKNFKERNNKTAEIMERQMEEQGGILASMILPNLTHYHNNIPDKKAFDSSRRMENTLIHKNMILLNCVLIFIAMTACILLSALMSRFTKEDKVFFPIPRAGDLLKHLFLTLILPLIFYETYKFLPFSSHAWSLKHSYIYLFVELISVTMLIPALSIYLWQRKSSRRLLNLQIKKPKLKNLISRYTMPFILCATPIVLIGPWLIINSINIPELLGLGSVLTFMGSSSSDKIHLLPLLGTICLALLFSFIVIRRLFKKSSRLHYACLCRSFLFYSSCCLLILTLHSTVFLRSAESHYSTNDSLMQAQANGLTAYEKQAVKNIRHE